MVKATVKLKADKDNAYHARPMMALAHIATLFPKCVSHLVVANTFYNAKSIMSLLGACVELGKVDEATIVCDGENAEYVCEKLTWLFNNDFDSKMIDQVKKELGIVDEKKK